MTCAFSEHGADAKSERGARAVEVAGKEVPSMGTHSPATQVSNLRRIASKAGKANSQVAGSGVLPPPPVFSATLPK